jgi:hypothetical protein
MKIAIESTTKLVQFEIDDGTCVPARVWEGHTDDGIPVHCFITRICPSIPEPLPADVEEQFKAALQECVPPTPAVQSIPLRMIL